MIYPMLVRKIWRAIPGRLRVWLIRRSQDKFTVSVAAVVQNENREVLILNHVLRLTSGWGLPGGFIDVGEQPDEAIRRELKEETGIGLTNVRLFRVRVLQTHIEMLFAATAIGEATVKSGEILELGWFSLDNLPKMMSIYQKETIRKVLNGEI